MSSYLHENHLERIRLERILQYPILLLLEMQSTNLYLGKTLIKGQPRNSFLQEKLISNAEYRQHFLSTDVK
jgi:hypothetical protein